LTTASEVYVPEQTIPAHTISATTTPRAVALMVGLLPLRRRTQDADGNIVEPCESTEGGGAIWRLAHGFIVTLEFEDNGSAVWHMDVEQEPRADETSRRGRR
jgi:hypothetical protein